MRSSAPSSSESKHLFALNIGKCHLKQNCEEKGFSYRSFLKINRISVKPCLNSCDLCEFLKIKIDNWR